MSVKGSTYTKMFGWCIVFISTFYLTVSNAFASDIEGTNSGEQILGTNENDVINGRGGDDTIFGFMGSDHLIGGEGNDRLQGGNGSKQDSDDDFLEGGEGNDVLMGEDGNDTLQGGLGGDHYYYTSGQDTLYDPEPGMDILFFLEAAESELSFHRDSDNLQIVVSGNVNNRVTVTDFFLNAGAEVHVQPNGGYMIQSHTITSRLSDSEPGDDSDEDGSEPDSSSDVIPDDAHMGTEHDDAVFGTSGPDSLFGGNGNDILMGLAGDDNYYIRAGDGHDTIRDFSGANRIVFTSSLNFSDVSSGLSRYGDSLVLNIGSNGQKVTVESFFALKNTVSELRFDSGQTISADQLFNAFGTAAPTEIRPSSNLLLGNGSNNLVVGSSSVDVIVTGMGDDELRPLAGDDWLFGGQGNDVYLIAPEGGADTIVEGDGENIVRLVGGISYSEVSSNLRKSSNHLILRLSETDVVTIYEFFSRQSTISSIEFEASESNSVATIEASAIFTAFGQPVPSNSTMIHDPLTGIPASGGDENLDGDNDGVVDANDLCPLTEETSLADENGCAPSQRDSDGDGINDARDQCPATQDEWDANEFGCSSQQLDTDEDGINDSDDQCPNTSTLESSDEQGCAPSQYDEDDDGVADYLDQCLGTPWTQNDNVDGNGCSPYQLDDDEDGRSNAIDDCPNTDLGLEVDVNGCAANQRDTDSDGVSDDIDTDIDGDGVLNEEDNFPYDISEQFDTDGDGVGNNQDLDDDGDTYSDLHEIEQGTDPLDWQNNSWHNAKYKSFVPKTSEDFSITKGDDGFYGDGAPRMYIDHGDVIYDKLNDLYWQDNLYQYSRYDYQEYPATFCGNLELGGRTDWRVPNRLELLSLVNLSTKNESSSYGYFALEPGFSFIRNTSSTAGYAANDDYSHYSSNVAFEVNFRKAKLTSALSSSSARYVRCVSGEEKFIPDFLSTFEFSLPLAVDRNSHLMWEDGPQIKENKGTWQEAIDYCETSDFMGYSDWRLPNLNESHSMLYEFNTKSTLDHLPPSFRFVPETMNSHRPRGSWWSSNPVFSLHSDYEKSQAPTKAWAFHYQHYIREPGKSGNIYDYQMQNETSIDEVMHFRCVRTFDDRVPKSYFETGLTFADETQLIGAPINYGNEIPVTYQWLVDSIEVGDESTITLNTLTEGEHLVELFVTSEDNHADHYRQIIEVLPTRPVPTTSLPPELVQYEQQVALDASDSTISSGFIDSYLWRIDGLDVSEEAVYTSESLPAGLYKIELVLTSDLGKQITQSATLKVIKRYVPTAILKGKDTYYQGHILLDASESSVPEGAITYAWSVDGVEAGTAEVFSPSELPVGTHEITLTVTAVNGGLTDSIVRAIEILPVPSSIDVFPETMSAYEGFVVLDATGIFDRESDLTYDWSVDGETIGQAISLPLPALLAGHYPVVLTVSTENGVLGSWSYTLDVQPTDKPIASLPSTMEMFEQHVVFDGRDSSIGSGILSHEWFVDGESIGTGEVVSPDLGQGTYTVTLVVTSNLGETDSTSSHLTVLPRPVPVAIIPDYISAYENHVVLDGSSSFVQSGSLSYEWFLNNNSIGLGQLINPELLPGEYGITLTVTSDHGLTDSYTSTLTVLETRSLETCPVAFAEFGVNLDYPDDELEWSSEFFDDVEEIAKAFNAGRLQDPSTDQILIMPDQADWDNMTTSEKGLYLINAERQARGLKPYSGLAVSVTEVAQAYADYILTNKVTINHYLQGTPSERLLSNSQIHDHASVALRPESLASRVSIKDVAPGAIIASAIYNFMYHDKYWYEDFGLDSGNSWGHRDHMLLPALNEDHDRTDSEGVVGIGVSIGPYQHGLEGGVVVINLVDQHASWDPQLIATVDTSQSNGCITDHDLTIDSSTIDLQGIVDLRVEPSNILVEVGESTRYTVKGVYSDQTEVDLTYYTEYLVDNNSIVSAKEGELTGLRQGSTVLRATIGDVQSNTVTVKVTDELDLSVFEGSAAEKWTPLIPDNASFSVADPYSLAIYSGKVLDRDGRPFPGVQVSLLNKPEYGTAFTDQNGRYFFAAQAGAQAIVFEKPGYLTIQRDAIGQTNTWASIGDVMLLPFDSKESFIDLSSGATQIHESSVVTDEFGSRKATIVFNDISSATVREPNGKTYPLTEFWMSATEYETPQSMPGELPVFSEFTYCTELNVRGLRYNDTITFDNDVIMFVDNFLNFKVGEIVPIGYFDQLESEWVASKNGVIVRTLDSDNDGVVDGIDHNDDGVADDLNENGTAEDDALGLSGYSAGQTLMWGAFNHFTPIDYNWAAEFGRLPSTDDAETGELPNNCDVCPTGSYVKPLKLSFHEDIPLVGAGAVLHYSSQRTADYKHEIITQVVGDDIPAGVTRMHAVLDVGGQTFRQEFSPIPNTEARFLWDGKDITGERIPGIVNAKIRIGYEYQVNYTSAGNTALSGGSPASFVTAWNVRGVTATDVPTRQNVVLWEDKGVRLKNTFPSQLAEGWSLTNVHELDPHGQLYLGGGQVQEVNLQSKLLKTGQTASFTDHDDGHYQSGGQDIQYSINRDGHIVDEVTGLIWENTDEPVYVSTHREFIDHCRSLPNNAEYAWRRPTTKEISYSAEKTGKDFGPFMYNMDNAVSLWHSSTSNPDRLSMPALCVSSKGFDRWVPLDYQTYAGMSRDNASDVVVDRDTGLMWQDTYDNETVELPWDQAIDYCESQTHAGFNDWRLPNINELLYALPNGQFSHQTELSWEEAHWSYNVTWREAYWSSTSNAAATDTQAWAIESESFNAPYFQKTDPLHVRCVRSANSANRMPYVFNAKGQHTRTIDLTTGDTLVTYGYDEHDRLVSMTDRFGNITTIERSYTGQPIAVIGVDGQRNTLVIDNAGNLKTIQYEDGTTFQFEYDGSLLIEKTDPNGNKFPHYFDENGRVTHTTNSEGGRWDFFDERTPNSNRYGYSTAEGNVYEVVRAVLDGGDIQKTITRENGSVTQSTVSEDQMLSTTEQCGVVSVVENVADPKTRLPIPSEVTITQPSGLSQVTQLTKVFASNGADPMVYTKTTTQEGYTTTVEVNGRTGVTVTTSAEGRTATILRETSNNLVSKIQTNGLFDTTFSYDNRGRITQTQTGDRVTTYHYDDAISNGQLTSVTTPDNQTIGYEYDLLGRVTAVTYPDGHRTETQYDANGNTTTVVVPTEQDHGFDHNGVNKVDEKTQPLSAPTTYTYDRDRRLTGITLPSGQTIEHIYVLGQKSQTITPESTRTYVYECGDKLIAVIEGSESLDYDYDGDLLTKLTYTGELAASIHYAYNDRFQVESTTYAGLTERFEYDGDGLSTQVGSFDINRHEQHGLPTSVSDEHQTRTLTYNGYGELNTSIQRFGSQAVYDYTLTYDDSGTIIGKTESLPDGTTDTYEYGYDLRNRLTSVTKNGTEVERYGYDANGNRLTTTSTARGVENQAAMYNAGDQITQLGDTTYTYDANGRLQTKTEGSEVTTYQYSSTGRLLSVALPNGDTITYRHNALGNRVTKLKNGTVVEKYLWQNKTTLLATFDENDNLKQRFEYALGHAPTAFTQGTDRFYIIADQIGSPRFITDESGTIVKAITYDSYGNVVSDTNPALQIPFGFASGLNDPDTDLLRFGYRDYDPQTGRWSARDPIGFAGGDTNLYGYVGANPIQFIDRTGLASTMALPELIPQVTPIKIRIPIPSPVPLLIALAPSGLAGPEYQDLPPLYPPLVPIPLTVPTGFGETCPAVPMSLSEGQRGIPYTGEPGEWISHPHGKQDRMYGPDGKPLVDIDYGHDHGQGSPHAHNWDENGRGPGLPVSVIPE